MKAYKSLKVKYIHIFFLKVKYIQNISNISVSTSSKTHACGDRHVCPCHAVGQPSIETDKCVALAT